MLGGETFCALRPTACGLAAPTGRAQRKMVRRADGGRCEEAERGGAESYRDVLRAPRTAKDDKADAPRLAPLMWGGWVDLPLTITTTSKTPAWRFFYSWCIRSTFLKSGASAWHRARGRCGPRPKASGRGCAGRAETRAGTPFPFALALGAAARAQPACASAQARNGQNPARQTAVPRFVSRQICRSFATPHFQRPDQRLTRTRHPLV